MNNKQKGIILISIMISATIVMFAINTETVVIIASESMNPTIRKGTIAFIDKEDIENIEVGNIICYYSEQNGVNIVHRVVDKQIDESNDVILNTKGDSNKSPDNEQITIENYIGKLGINIWITNIFIDFLPKILALGIAVFSYIKIKERHKKCY